MLTLGRLAGPCAAEAARLQRELLRRAGRTDALVSAIQRDADGLTAGDPEGEALLRELEVPWSRASR